MNSAIALIGRYAGAHWFLTNIASLLPLQRETRRMRQ